MFAVNGGFSVRIFVDADGCPGAVKDILYKASERLGIELILIANRFMPIKSSPLIHFVLVPGGFDMADDAIAERAQRDDLVITADVPLAARVVEKGAFALNPRGTIYDANSIGAKLSMRNSMEELRNSGVETGGPNAFSLKDRQRFAQALDKFLAKRKI